MKKLVLIISLSLYVELFAFNWNLPPVQEEIMGENSNPDNNNVLGEVTTRKNSVVIDSTDVITGKVVTLTPPPTNVVTMPYIDRIKIALLVPQKVIGRYASSVSNSIISYLLFRDIDFQFEVFDSKTEDDLAILEKLSLIHI